MGTVVFSLSFQNDESKVKDWVEGLHSAQIKDLLKCLFITFQGKAECADVSQLTTVLSRLESMLSADQRRIVLTEAATDACRLKERELMRNEYEEKSERQRVHQEDELRSATQEAINA